MNQSQNTEATRLAILNDPALLQQLRTAQPELASAIDNPERFREVLQCVRAQNENATREQTVEQLNRNPYDLDAQQRMEELLRQEAVAENMQHALEYTPELFSKVEMLYVPVEVNGHPLKAFVNPGAQSTIISAESAEACGIMRLLDTRFAGVARGLGTANILGRVHSAQMKVSDLYLPCAFTVIEGQMEMNIGLDILKAHRAIIDLDKDCLNIQGHRVPFMREGEQLPTKREAAVGPPMQDVEESKATSSGSVVSSKAPAPGPAATKWPEKSIQALMDLGATREVAIQLLDQAHGALDIAASLLF